MERVNVNREVLMWAIKRAGCTPEIIEKKLPKIQEWIEGQSQPTFRQIEKLAKITRTPVGYFFLSEPPQERLDIPFYRTFEEHEDEPSVDLVDTIKIIKRRQDWMRQYLIELGHSPLPYVHSADNNDKPKEIVNRIRDMLNIDKNWASGVRTWEDALKFLREAMTEKGIFVVFNGVVENNTTRNLDPEEFRGFVLSDNYAPFVFVNNKDSKAANMFTLAHELAHIFLGKSSIFDLRRMFPAEEETEKFCDKIAAEFLVPEEALSKVWSGAEDIGDNLDRVARHFKVSVLVAARRALDLEYLTRSQFFQFYENYKRDERREATKDKGRGDFYSNQNIRVGKRFFMAVNTALNENKITYKEAYQLTGLRGKTFDKYAASIGLGGWQGE